MVNLHELRSEQGWILKLVFGIHIHSKGFENYQQQVRFKLLMQNISEQYLKKEQAGRKHSNPRIFRRKCPSNVRSLSKI